MDLVKKIAELESTNELHLARIILILGAFSGKDGEGRVQGLTKLAKLDFLLRYPVMLEKALEAKHKPSQSVEVKDYERNSVESKMVRYRFGPWDHRYRYLLNVLIGKGLVTVNIEGRTISIGLTKKGIEIRNIIASSVEFEDMVTRVKIIKSNFDVKATTLMRFIYDTFPEILTLRPNEAIST